MRGGKKSSAVRVIAMNTTDRRRAMNETRLFHEIRAALGQEHVHWMEKNGEGAW